MQGGDHRDRQSYSDKILHRHMNDIDLILLYNSSQLVGSIENYLPEFFAGAPRTQLRTLRGDHCHYPYITISHQSGHETLSILVNPPIRVVPSHPGDVKTNGDRDTNLHFNNFIPRKKSSSYGSSS